MVVHCHEHPLNLQLIAMAIIFFANSCAQDTVRSKILVLENIGEITLLYYLTGNKSATVAEKLTRK